MHERDYLRSSDNVSFAYSLDYNDGPGVRGMIFLLSSCHELSSRIRTLTMFRLSCLCLQHVVLDSPEVKFESPNGVGAGPDLSDVFRLLQSYLLRSNTDCKVFTDTSPIADCLEVVESSARSAVKSDYNPWTNVDFCEKDRILK